MPDVNALSELRSILGPKGYSDDQDVIYPWLTDWRGRFTGAAAALLSPATTQEVAAIVRVAATYRLSLVPQGGNSGMVAGATPNSSGDQLILSMRRMNNITAIDADTGLISCEAGVILQNLHEAAAQAGRRFPLTLGGKGSATVGGLISTNAGGTQVLRHGTMRLLVAGLEAVLPDGSIYDAMAPLKKDNRGYDLKQLLIGGEGTIGVVTKAVLQTVPALIDRCVVWAGVDSPQQAYELLLFMQKHGRDRLEGFEILPQRALNAVLTHISGTRPPLDTTHRWHALMEFVQDDPAQSSPGELAMHLLEDAIADNLLENATIARSDVQAEAFWKIRDSIAEAERAAGAALQHDISVPVAAMARFIEQESPRIEADYPGTKTVAFGHLGDGNIHFHVKAPEGVDIAGWYAGDGKAITSHVYDRVRAYGGSLSAEHGIGQSKIDEFARLGEPARLSALRAIKNAFDPLGIMNPGKLVPLA
ncbi:FAD/FMN-containing dehydrogenase [Sphingorhabdus rigui]|uniref:FAD/FMN-containing dehydrogenase n=1 Tax=Sphingorhabdus rigui TaxID=1282858 RepID=A0A840AZB5_9SPHN|nr:FAD-binding oxidoreductase [Sphingorhabdus rigui]MBB3943448.1 FAD/FMN-containing dehydrogenase [Sphingorhabdus rigui]